MRRRDADESQPLIADFLDLQKKMTYKAFRKALLRFCLTEAIAPEAVAGHIDGRKEYWLSAEEHLSHVITTDTPLLCTWLAHRMFTA